MRYINNVRLLSVGSVAGWRIAGAPYYVRVVAYAEYAGLLMRTRSTQRRRGRCVPAVPMCGFISTFNFLECRIVLYQEMSNFAVTKTSLNRNRVSLI